MHTPKDMPGASQKAYRPKPLRRVKVTYERGTGGAVATIIGRLLINPDDSSVYFRRGLLEIRGESPNANDWTIPYHRVITVEFVDPDARLEEL